MNYPKVDLRPQIQNPVRYYNEKGLVGVVISPDYGFGWSAYENDPKKAEFMRTNPALVKAVLEDAENFSEIQKIFKDAGIEYPGDNYLEVQFLKPGTKFYIDEYDGLESIRTVDEIIWTVA